MDDERTTIESEPMAGAPAPRTPRRRRKAAEDQRETLEVASVNSPAVGWNPPGVAPGPGLPASMEEEHGLIDSDEDEPTMEASARDLKGHYRDIVNASAFDRQRGGPSARPASQGRRAPLASVPEAARGKLVVAAGNDNGHEFLLAGNTLSIGRALGNDIVLTDIAVSRKHMSLEFDGQRYRIVDHGSGNGTLINDRLETGICQLTDGDRLELGNTVFRFEHPASRVLPAGMPAAEAPGFVPPEDDFDEVARTVVGKSKAKIVLPPVAEPALPAAPQMRAPLPPPAEPDAARASSVAPAPPVELPRPVTSAPPRPMTARPATAQPGPPVVPPRPLTGTPMRAPSPVAEGGRHGSEPSFGLNPSLPPGQGTGSAEVFLGTSSVPYYVPVQPRSSQSKMLIFGLLVAAVGAMVLVVGVFLSRHDAGAQGENANRDEAIAASDRLASQGLEDENARKRRLPDSTWGTSETMLVAVAGAGDTTGQQEDTTAEAPDEEPAVVPKDDPAPNTTEELDAPAPAIDEDEEDEEETTEVAAKDSDSKQTGPVKRSANTTRTRRVAAVSSPPRDTTGAARKRAQSQYKSREFAQAAQTLRAAAEGAGSEAGSLRTLASNYEKIGTFMDSGNAGANRDPAAALEAYNRALSLDRRHGGGEHATFLRSKIAAVAPRAAAAFMAKGRYESAKSAADSANAHGEGKNPMVQRVRQGLERKADEFYKSALRMRDEPAKAETLLKRILNIVPPDSPTYTKAYRRLNTP